MLLLCFFILNKPYERAQRFVQNKKAQNFRFELFTAEKEGFDIREF